MKIIVLAGGDSSEREVSIRSGITVARALITLGHTVAFLDPIKAPHPLYCTNNAELATAYAVTQAEKRANGHLHDGLLESLKGADLVFPALHGGIGEDGRLQALMECRGIPFVGSGSVACAIAMDKALCKQIYEANGILTPLYTVYRKGQRRPAVPPRYPCVVKPASGGSSVGVTAVHMPSTLAGAVNAALSECDTVIMEELIQGRELSVSVLRDRPLAATEIIPKSAFYDYESKYEKNGAREITPAPLPRELYIKALNIAINAHNAIGMRNFSRTDIILEAATSHLYALETNALPGLTETSILPNAAKASGIDPTSLIEMMLR